MTGRNRWQWLILAALFLLLFLFFNATAQFLPWNGDDWRYLSQYRPPYPTLRLWNPARVFPEVLQPLLGLMSASLVWPLTDTYPDAVRITACLTATVCICCLAWAVLQLLRAMTTRNSVALFGMLLFVAFAFFLFKNKTDGNIYLFYASSITILCFYQIPNIANAVLTLGLLSAHFYGWPRLRGRWPLQGCLVLFTLCALFSMTTASLISATCAATLVLVRLLGSPGTGLRQKIASCIRNATGFESYLFFILACWFAAALLDVNGTRYAHLTPSGFHLADTVALTRGLLANMRFSAIIVTVAAAGAAILHAGWKLRRMQRERNFLLLCLILCSSGLLCLIGDFCIAARTAPSYACSIHFMFGFFFYLAMLLIVSVAWLLRECARFWLVAPLLLCFFLIESTRSDRPWQAAQTAEQRPIVQAWLKEAQQQDAAGADTAVITVPRAEWPHPREWFGEVLAHTLFAHGLTTRKLHIVLREAADAPPVTPTGPKP